MRFINVIKSIQQVYKAMVTYKSHNPKINSLPQLEKSEVRIERITKEKLRLK